MVLQQILKYIDKNLNPELGTKVQIAVKDNVEVIKMFIFNKENKSYDYIMNFMKETTDDVKSIKCSMSSGYSGMDYKLECEINEEIYEEIKKAIVIADNIHLKSLENQINSIEVEMPKTEEVITEIQVDVPKEEKPKRKSRKAKEGV